AAGTNRPFGGQAGRVQKGAGGRRVPGAGGGRGGAGEGPVRGGLRARARGARLRPQVPRRAKDRRRGVRADHAQRGSPGREEEGAVRGDCGALRREAGGEAGGRRDQPRGGAEGQLVLRQRRGPVRPL
ncbi:MAG: hypothetical protein AVDCRST_MAG22-1313, partial [uncultured Rubrobacteraceae bacterium]